MEPHYFDMAITAAGCLVGLWLKSIRNTLNELVKSDANLTKTDSKLSDDINDLKVLVASEYVKQQKFDDVMKALFVKLDRMEDKMDDKADKGVRSGH